MSNRPKLSKALIAYGARNFPKWEKEFLRGHRVLG